MAYTRRGIFQILESSMPWGLYPAHLSEQCAGWGRPLGMPFTVTPRGSPMLPQAAEVCQMREDAQSALIAEALKRVELEGRAEFVYLGYRWVIERG